MRCGPFRSPSQPLPAYPARRPTHHFSGFSIMIDTNQIIPPPPLPFPRSCWAVPGLLLAGAFPGARDEKEATEKIEALLDAGIAHIVNLMEPDETDLSGRLFSPYEKLFSHMARNRGIEASCARFPVRDLGVKDW